MGKGDQRSRRGKIYRGTFGKSRPKNPQKPATSTRSSGPVVVKPAAAAKARPGRKS